MADVAQAQIGSRKITFDGIMIDDGWTVGDLTTLDDCDEAFAVLTAHVADIEGQLDLYDAGIGGDDPVWAARARAALRWKKAALQAVNIKRARFSREAKQARAESFAQAFVTYAKERLDDDEFEQICDEARQKAAA